MSETTRRGYRSRMAWAWVAGSAIAVWTGCVTDADPSLAMISAGEAGSGDEGEENSGDVSRLDVGAPDAPQAPEACRRVGEPTTEMCDRLAPPDAFEPEVQWSWTDPGQPEVWVTPLVANMTDDNGDGAIDEADVPDVIVVATRLNFEDYVNTKAGIVVLSGADGTSMFRAELPVAWQVTPAVGDVDGDGRPEIVTATSDADGGEVVVFDDSGSLQWASKHPGYVDRQAVALADLDGDGSVEIIFGGGVYDFTGALVFDTHHDDDGVPVAADLDGDGRLEVVYGSAAYRADGTVYYDTDVLTGFPHVGNFDDDPEPEIVVTNQHGINLLDHLGQPVWLATPTTDPANYLTGQRPGTIHDFDGDCQAEFAYSTGREIGVYEIGATGPTVVWQSEVLDHSGASGSTAFDFDGDGRAEILFADEHQLHVFDSRGETLFTTRRQSGTLYEYPVVADVDNDGSAEIVVVSNLDASAVNGGTETERAPAVQVIRDVDDRWIQARRIWNQHSYNVVNVTEDGTIPAVPKESWLELNTFRTNAQIEDGTICQPVP